MSRALYLLAILKSTLLFSAENEFYIKPQSSWIETIEYDTSYHLYNDNKEDGGTYLLLDFQQNVALQESFRHYTVRIDEETGIQNYSDLWINYTPSYQQLIFHKLIIHRNNHQIDRLKKDYFKIVQNETELERKIYSENYSAGINIEDVQVGDIIEYSYTIKGENPIFGGMYFDTYRLNYSVPINKLIIQVIYPKDRNVNYKLINTKQTPIKSTVNNHTQLKWELKNIAEVVLNTNLPTWYNVYAQVQFSEFNKWSDVTQWSDPLYPDVDIKNSELEIKFNEISKSQLTKNEKINSLIRFVQDEIRYVGIEVDEHSHKPHNPIEVYTKRFGDCKDKTYLLVTLLRHLGVETWPAYVNTNLKQEILHRLPSPTIFNHVIVAILYKDEIYFIDPTFGNQRGDFTKAYNGNYKSALILRKESSGITDMQINSIEKIIINEKIEISDSVKPTKYQVFSRYFGGEADQIRSTFKNQTTKELEVSYLDFYDYLYPNMRLVNPINVDDIPENNVIKVQEDYEIDNFWTFNNSASVNDYEATINATNLEYYISTPNQKNRTMPFALYYPIEIENKIEYLSNKNIQIDEECGEIKNSCFSFTYAIKKKGKTVVFNYTYKTLKDVVLVEELEQYYKDIDKVSNQIWYTFTYGKIGQELEDKTLNWLMIILISFFTIILLYLATRLYQRDLEVSVVQANSVPIGGWLVLPVIGVYLVPFILLYTIITSGLFSLASWEFISSPDSVGYSVIWTIAFLNEVLMNSFLLVYSIFLIVLLIKKRTIFPVHYVVFRVIFLAYIIIDASLLNSIESEYYSHDTSNIDDITRAIISAFIWIPYMIKSQRVKHTFINRYK